MLGVLLALLINWTAGAAAQNVWIRGDSVGVPCAHSQQCSAYNARCFDGECLCLTSHVLVDRLCLPKVEPGMSGCSRNEQCSAVWPGTQCSNSICVCPNNQIQVRTRSGVVCLPEYGRVNTVNHSKLIYISDPANVSASCPFGGRDAVLRDESGNIATCYVNPKSGYMSGCLGHMHMYDCVRDTTSPNATASYYCCPNKANVCSQPMNEGVFPTVPIDEPQQQQPEPTGPRARLAVLPNVPWYHRDDGTVAPVTTSGTQQPTPAEGSRWYFDRIGLECLPFNYRGAGGSANNFASQQHCLHYCRSACPRGQPQSTVRDADGKVHQFAQRTQMCSPSQGCSDASYSCLVVMPGKALCCPDRTFICSEFGGFAQVTQGAFHPGVPCGDGRQPERRYYFDRTAGSCLPFEYAGCAGNHNNFASLIECQRFCGAADEFDRQRDAARVSGLGDQPYRPPELQGQRYILLDRE